MIIRYTPAAREDLRQIKEYISLFLQNPVAAENVTSKIVNKCSILKTAPNCGVILQNKIDKQTDLRVLICDNYLVFYKLQDNCISIIRILDGRTDYLHYLFNE